ncbi:hypothetical protein BGW41_007889, partial [Actinomortierella wolfii]
MTTSTMDIDAQSPLSAGEKDLDDSKEENIGIIRASIETATNLLKKDKHLQI